MTARMKALVALSAVVASLSAAPALADDHLGLNTHVPGNDLLDLCTDLGVGWIRVDANWLDLNPASGRYEWAEMDRVVDGARSRGLRVYMTLAYTPSWVPRVTRARTDTNPGNDEPATSAEWVSFVNAAVARYRPRGVTHFGLWNEPNLGGFWEDGAGADSYIDKILVPGAAAVRRSCADCVVLGPDLAHVGAYDTFLDRVLERASSSIDILAHHIYQGWPETGTTVFSGDNFLQALEARRFPFTRAALREVLDRRGFTRQVWITETGLRARVGDAADETRQATYVRRVMEEQLSRAWWSNTFFYEIMDCGVDQPTCDIDGFGITRPLRSITGGPRAWPADYRRKPAYDAIRAFITAHPEIVSRTPPAQCGNGLDDDRDGRIDADDRGCRDGTDPNEADDPPRRTLEARAGAVTPDGDLSEWGSEGWLTLAPTDWVGTVPYGGPSDLSARIAARWTSGAIYVALEVTDDRHANDRDDDTLWAADSVQLAFDTARNYGRGYDTTDDHELNFALARGSARSYRFHGPTGATPPGPVAVRRDGTVTRYELALSTSALRVTPREGLVLGFSFLVNDHDGASTEDGTGREGWLELTPGIGVRKEPYYFGELRLTGGAPTGDAGVTDSGLDVPSPIDRPTPVDVAPPTDTGRDTGARDTGQPAGDTGSLDVPVATDAGADARPADVGSEPSDPVPLGCACDVPGGSAGSGGGWRWLALAVALYGLRVMSVTKSSWSSARRSRKAL